LIDDRAVLHADAAPGAELRVDASGPLPDLHLEVTGGPFDGLDIGVGNKLYIEMPADLDQFGRDDSHGAVVGGKGLVQLGHDAANGRRLLEEVNIITGIGQIEGRLHPGYTSADDKNRAFHLVRHISSP
jgi:hypothetical protein